MTGRALAATAVLLPTLYAAYAAYAALPQAAQTPPPAGAGQAKSGPRLLDVKFESITIDDRTGDRELRIATFTDADTVFHGDLIRFNQKEKVAVATGNLKVSDPQADVTGDKATIYYAKARRLVVLTGNVHVTLKPRKGEAAPAGPAPVKIEGDKAVVQTPAGDEDDSVASARKHPTEITCDRVEYEYARDKKHGILTGSFRAVQKLPDNTRTLVASKAEWFGKDERVDLHPPVHYEDTKGNKLDSNDLVPLITREGAEGLQIKGGTGTIEVPDEEQESPPPAKPPQG